MNDDHEAGALPVPRFTGQNTRAIHKEGSSRAIDSAMVSYLLLTMAETMYPCCGN